MFTEFLRQSELVDSSFRLISLKFETSDLWILELFLTLGNIFENVIIFVVVEIFNIRKSA